MSRKTGIAKAIGSGTGALGGGLTLIGGVLTIASAGMALPVLLAGTSIGLAAGVGGGAVLQILVGWQHVSVNSVNSGRAVRCPASHSTVTFTQKTSLIIRHRKN